MQLLRNEFVGWLTERLSFQPLELRRVLAGIRDHLLQRRQFTVEIAALLIHEREPAPDVEVIGKFRGRFLKKIDRSLHIRFILLERNAPR